MCIFLLSPSAHQPPPVCVWPGRQAVHPCMQQAVGNRCGAAPPAASLGIIAAHAHADCTLRVARCGLPVLQSVLTGEGGGKFSLSLGSSSKHHGPTQTIQLSGGGMHDAALSPDGAKLAAACADGALRLVDMASGTVIGG